MLSTKRSASNARYKRTPRGQYADHKAHARHRNVEFLLSFEEWWRLWESSGKWEQRGNRKGCYNMLRLNDQGPYAVGNVRIGLHQANTIERNILQRKYRQYEREAIERADTQFNDCPF